MDARRKVPKTNLISKETSPKQFSFIMNPKNTKQTKIQAIEGFVQDTTPQKCRAHRSIQLKKTKKKTKNILKLPSKLPWAREIQDHQQGK